MATTVPHLHNPSFPRVMPKPIVLPHGTAHKTPAGQNLIRLATSSGGKKKAHTRRPKAGLVSAAGKKTRKRKKKAGAVAAHRKAKGHLVKGSAAAKKYMASIRKKRKTTSG